MANAKITVEASLIIPLIISIICALLYEALLSCDRGAINMTVDRVAEEAAADYGHAEEKKENIVDLSNKLKDEISKRLMIYSIEDLSYKIKNEKIIVSVHAVPKAAFGIAGMFRGAFGEYRINRTVKNVNICSAIRRMDIVKGDS